MERKMRGGVLGIALVGLSRTSNDSFKAQPMLATFALSLRLHA
jgi:hypothetical protein